MTGSIRTASTLEVIPSEDDPTEELLKACADSVRLRILRALRHDSFSVSELCVILEMKQPAVSHHLKVLLGVGLLAIRREGASMANSYRFGARRPCSSPFFSIRCTSS
jgi:ArsR family transcriptional regulator